MAFTDTTLKLEQIPVGENRCVKVGEAQVGLFHRKEGLFALDNICPHRSAPLHEGFVSEGQVTCPWHQWQFQLEDGVCRNIPNIRIEVYPVEVRDGTVWVDLDNPKKP